MHDVRTAELPTNAFGFSILSCEDVVALIIFTAVNLSSPVATTTTQPSTQKTIATTIPKTGKTPMTEKFLTQQGTMLNFRLLP